MVDGCITVHVHGVGLNRNSRWEVSLDLFVSYRCRSPCANANTAWPPEPGRKVTGEWRRGVVSKLSLSYSAKLDTGVCYCVAELVEDILRSWKMLILRSQMEVTLLRTRQQKVGYYRGQLTDIVAPEERGERLWGHVCFLQLLWCNVA